LPNTAGDDHTNQSESGPTAYDQSTAPVAAFSAYTFASPPPTYRTDVAVPTGTSVVTVPVLATPAEEGSVQAGGLVVPKFVCHRRFPDISVARS
jgi:hypothetical protein